MAFGEQYQETPEQKRMFKLMACLQQIDNLTKLLDDNEYRDYLYNHLMPIKCEIDRQMSFILKEENNDETIV